MFNRTAEVFVGSDPNGYSYVHLCRTEDQHANMLTKVEALEAFLRSRKVMFNL